MASLPYDELLALSQTDVAQKLTPQQFGPVLCSAPFVHIEGTFNARDLGLVPGRTGATAHKLRPGFVFRSGMLNYLTPEGKATLAGRLKVRRIFDLRSQSEHQAGPDPSVGADVAMVWSETAEANPDVDLAPFVEGLGEAGFAAMYMDVLRAYRPTFRLMLEHIRDRPAEAFLFHCTAGRDRTGVAANMLLALAGAPDDVITLDYLLSRIGSEPVREQLEAFARKGAIAASGAGSSATEMPPGFHNLISLHAQCLEAFHAALEKEYGPRGFQGYVTQALGFTDEDLVRIKTNLTTAPN